jgi:hypothetical protein
MHQASLADGLTLDAFALEQDGLAPPEVDVGRVRSLRLSWQRWWL